MAVAMLLFPVALLIDNELVAAVHLTVVAAAAFVGAIAADGKAEVSRCVHVCVPGWTHG